MPSVVVHIDGPMDFFQAAQVFLNDIKVALVVLIQADGVGNTLQAFNPFDEF